MGKVRKQVNVSLEVWERINKAKKAMLPPELRDRVNPSLDEFLAVLLDSWDKHRHK